MSSKLSNSLNYFSGNIIGARKRQEDADSITMVDGGEGLLFVVADGMGGHEAGDVASNSVVDTFVKAYQSSQQGLQMGYRLTNALHASNNKIHEIINQDHQLRGMGSTLIAAQIYKNTLSWVSVGDSMLVLVRGRKLRRLNADHSMKPVLEQAIKTGNLTRVDAKTHPERNSLRSALTGDEISLIDMNEAPFKLKKGDVLILSSDGLLTLSDTEIETIVGKNLKRGAKEIVNSLMDVVL